LAVPVAPDDAAFTALVQLNAEGGAAAAPKFTMERMIPDEPEQNDEVRHTPSFSQI
jgi:hypothetical protein